MILLTEQERIAVLVKMDPEQRLETYCDLIVQMNQKILADSSFYNSQEYDDLLDECQCYWLAMPDEEREEARRRAYEPIVK